MKNIGITNGHVKRILLVALTKLVPIKENTNIIRMYSEKDCCD